MEPRLSCRRPETSRFTHSSFLITLFLLAGFMVHPCLAQDDDFDYADFSLAELMDVDLVYGASRYEEKVSDAPSAVTIVTADDIKDFGYTSLAEILNSVRGFYTSNDHNYQYLGARGFGLPGDYNSRVLMLIDGVRLNENMDGAGSVGSEFPLDLSLIERVEVVRGPSSSVYGSNALFGVINVITKKGHQIDGVEGEVQAGSFGHFKARVTAGGSLGNQGDWLLSGTTGVKEGQDRYFSEFSEEPSLGIYQDNDRNRWSHLFARASHGDFHVEGLFGWMEKQIPTASYETEFNHPLTRSEDNQGFVSGWYQGEITTNTSLLSKLSYHLYNYVGTWPYDYAEEDEEPWVVINMDDSLGRWLTFENQVTRSFDAGHKLAFGLDWQRNLQQDQSAWDSAPDYWPYLAQDQQSTHWGAYVTGDYKFHSRFHLNLGLRHDQYSTFGGTLNPRLAFVGHPLEGSVFKLLYGSAFRAPSQYELFFHDGDETTKANPDLDPETIKTYEIVWDQQLGDNIHGIISAFYYECEDLIEQDVDPEDDLLVFGNSSMVQAQGFEAELIGRRAGGLRHSLSYSYQSSEYEDGGKLANSPQHLVKFHLAMPLNPIQSLAGLEVLYNSKRRTHQDTWADGFTLVNLTLNKSLADEQFHIRGGVYNLFDEEYSYPGGVEHVQDRLFQDGRSLRLTLVARR